MIIIGTVAIAIIVARHNYRRDNYRVIAIGIAATITAVSVIMAAVIRLRENAAGAKRGKNYCKNYEKFNSFHII